MNPLQASAPLFTLEDLEEAYKWIFQIRKNYSPHSDIWRLRRNWEETKLTLLNSLNEGSYQFSLLDRYEFDDGGVISLWSSEDMISLKLISQALGARMKDVISPSCYHVQGHGGLKKAVVHTHEALPHYKYVLRSDIKSFYESIRFDALMAIIETYVTHPALLTLIRKALRRTETRGGIFYDYDEKGLPCGSPLSPILGAIALVPLDQAMDQNNEIFYSRFMDDWIVLTKSKTALRKVVKLTHQIVNAQKLELHPMKTYIGKISHGFNFLGYYFDDQKLLPSLESQRRFFERALALYEQPPTTTYRRHKKTAARGRDISDYQADEEQPNDEYFKNILITLQTMISHQPETEKRMRRYLGQWSRWLKIGLSTIKGFLESVEALLPSLFSCWRPGAMLTHGLLA